MTGTAWDADHVGDTITGDELAAARSRAGLTQKGLAELLRHSESTIQKWEAGQVADGKEPLVRAVLGSFLIETSPAAPPPLSSYSNWALLSELGRRLEESQNRDPIARQSGGASGTYVERAVPNEDDHTTPDHSSGRIRGRGPRKPGGARE